MNWFQAIIIAIVEGLTEFLPVSSTGHMIITEAMLGMQPDAFAKLFIIVIQFAAILSVVILYYKRFFQSFDFYVKLFVAFIPAAILGKLFDDYIDTLLGNVWVVAVMLVAGGVVLIFVDKWFAKNEENQNDTNEYLPISYKNAFIIGLFQTIAMIPGVSRSAATIIGGLTQKLNRKRAAEFSFFLAVPTMFAASAYKLYKFIKEEDISILTEKLDVLIIGNVVAFVVALIAIKFFINILTKYGFKAFGFYRIAVGLIIIALLLAGIELKVM